MRAHLHYLLGLAAFACTDGADPSETTTVQVQTRTTGGDLDLDGYVIVVDQLRFYPIPPNGRVDIPDLLAGGHEFALQGIAPNCEAPHGAVLGAEVHNGIPMNVLFEIACDATGIRVITSLDGLDTDGGFQIILNDVLRPEPAQGNGFQDVTRLAPGEYTVRLGEVAANCSMGPVSSTVVVEFRQVTPVEFTGHCVAATGVVLFRISTSGEDVDQSGYIGSVTGASGVLVPPGADALLLNVPPGTQAVRLSEVAPNCTVEGSNPRDVVVTAGADVRDTAVAEFDVGCVRFWDLAFLRGGRISLAATDGGSIELVGVGGRPTWSPDGRRLAFACGAICIMNLDASRTVTLPVNVLVDDLAWRPDGSGLLFTASSCDAYYSYYCYFEGLAVFSPADGTWRKVRLPTTVLWASGGAWAPDGSTIAFACRLGFNNEEICLVRADGSGFARLTSGAGFNADPAWSPDGSRIAFSTSRFGGMEVVVMNADGSGFHRLAPPAWGRYPAWSPDGAKILYSSTNPVGRGLTLVNPDGSGSVRLTTHPQDLFAVWRP